MLPSLASTDELEVWLDSPISNVARAAAMLNAASTVVRAYKGSSYVEDDELTDVPDEVRVVTLLVTERLLANVPDGLSQESLGSFSESWSRGGLYLTAAEKAMLDGPQNSLTSVKVTVPNFFTTPEDDDEDDEE